jgi:hypothetical protein
MSSGTGSSPPPPPGNKSMDKNTDIKSAYTNLKVPLSGDGKTPQTATWSGVMFHGPIIKKTYIVNGIGLEPQYRRTNVDEARDFMRQGYKIMDGETYEPVTQAQIPLGPLGNPSMPASHGIDAQMQEVIAHENAIATGSGAATDAYHAAQVHRRCNVVVLLVYCLPLLDGDAFAASDNDGGNSSDEAVGEWFVFVSLQDIRLTPTQNPHRRRLVHVLIAIRLRTKLAALPTRLGLLESRIKVLVLKSI